MQVFSDDDFDVHIFTKKIMSLLQIFYSRQKTQRLAPTSENSGFPFLLTEFLRFTVVLPTWGILYFYLPCRPQRHLPPPRPHSPTSLRPIPRGIVSRKSVCFPHIGPFPHLFNEFTSRVVLCARATTRVRPPDAACKWKSPDGVYFCFDSEICNSFFAEGRNLILFFCVPVQKVILFLVPNFHVLLTHRVFCWFILLFSLFFTLKVETVPFLFSNKIALWSIFCCSNIPVLTAFLAFVFPVSSAPSFRELRGRVTRPSSGTYSRWDQ